MVQVTGMTAAKMQEIYDASIVDATIDANGNLILTTQGGTQFNLGDMHGPQGVQGNPGSITKVAGVGDDGTGNIPLTAASVGAASSSDLSALVPAGTILQTARSVAPTGYLLCQGQLVSRTTYAALFAAIGQAYGVGNGSTTFGIPDLRARTAAGRDTSNTAFASLGQTGGSATHKHDSGTLLSAISWAASGRILMRRIASAVGWTGNSANSSGNYVPLGTQNENSTGGVSVEGATDAASSYSPYQVLNYMIKT